MGAAADDADPAGHILHLLHHHKNIFAHPVLGTLGGELLDEPGNEAPAPLDLVGLKVSVERLGLGALLVGVSEDPDDVEPGRFEESAELGEVRLGLAREAHDDIRADARQRRPGPDRLHEAEEVHGPAEPPHPTKQRRRGVLEGQVEVRHDPRGVGEDVEQPGTHLGGLEVGHPHPLDARHLGQAGQQGFQRAQLADVLPV